MTSPLSRTPVGIISSKAHLKIGRPVGLDGYHCLSGLAVAVQGRHRNGEAAGISFGSIKDTSRVQLQDEPIGIGVKLGGRKSCSSSGREGVGPDPSTEVAVFDQVDLVLSGLVLVVARR